MKTWRSLLFVAAHDERRVAKVYQRGADAVVFDLEDGVPEHAKEGARLTLGRAPEGASVPTVVRVNNRPDLLNADLEASVRANVTAVMIPKVEHAQTIEAAATYLSDRGRGKETPIIALLESPLAIERLPGIAAARGLGALALGVEDFAAALEVPPHPENLDLPCRLIALSAAAQGLAAFGAPIGLSNFEQVALFSAACGRARLMGLTGALCIHPEQVAAANEAYAPSEQELVHARAIMRAWREGGETGVVRLGAQMIDAPLVRQAETILARRRR